MSQLFKPEFLKRMINLAKSQKVQFAFASTDEGESLVLHDTLEPKALWGKLRAETKAAASEGCFGQAWVQGSALVIDPDRKMSGCKKSFTAMLKEEGLKVKRIRFADEPDEEPAPAAEAAQAALDELPVPEADPETDDPELAANRRSTATATKAAEAWAMAVNQTSREIAALQGSVIDAGDLDNNPVVKMLEQFLKEMPDLGGALRTLAGETSSGDPNARRTKATVQGMIADARTRLASPLGRMIAANPFHPVAVDDRLGVTLKVIEKSLA